MLTITLDPKLEERLSELARRTGRSVDDHARELIEANIEDLEDRYLAETRLDNPQKPLTSNETRRLLGLDD